MIRDPGTHTSMARFGTTPIARLWALEWNGSTLACNVYRDGSSLELRVESREAVVLREPFRMEPRALARTRVLRDGLKRRGWRDAGPTDTAPGAHHDGREG